MSAQYTPRLPWEAAFLDALAKSNIINHAARVAGISPGTFHALRKRNEAFGRECARILQRAGRAKTAPAPAKWKRVFLEALVSSNPTGDWAGKASAIAGFAGGSWLFAAPTAGMRVWDKSTHQELLFDGLWLRPEKPVSPVGGAVVDSELRTAFVSLVEALRISGIFPDQ